MSWYYPAKPYVGPAELAKKLEKALKRSGREPQVPAPVKLNGKTIADTFWGKAWCANLERYSDFENRLPRGRTYVRKGAVAHLHVEAGSVVAFVNGSDLYRVELTIAPLVPARWKAIRKDCSGSIGSLVELLSGKLSGSVMQRICEPKTGLFPAPAEIKVSCSCPDWADVCKHVAAVIYGIGARLDTRPEILFRLRQVDEQELIAKAAELQLAKPTKGSKKVLATDDLSALFGLEMANDGGAHAQQVQVHARTKRETKVVVVRTYAAADHGKTVGPPLRASRVRSKAPAGQAPAKATARPAAAISKRPVKKPRSASAHTPTKKTAKSAPIASAKPRTDTENTTPKEERRTKKSPLKRTRERAKGKRSR